MDFLSVLLEHYHRTEKDLEARHASGSFASLSRPDGFPGFSVVIGRLKKAASDKEKCVIYGDYDTDGLTSTAIRKRTLDERKVPCGFFIPSRYHEGYGLNEKRVRQFKEKGYSLIICVDNGRTAFSSIDLALSLGREVIVIDHHQKKDNLPSTPYLFSQITDAFVPYNCSAASLALFVSSALLNRFDPYFVTLAGIAVFSDVRPLIGNNLFFAQRRLSNRNKYRYPNLFTLLGNPGEVGYEDVSYTLIPALNSPGRALTATRSTIDACNFLLERDDSPKRKQLADFLLSANWQRKKRTASLVPSNGTQFSSEHALCFIAECLSGRNGLLANKVRKKENRPVGVFSPSERDKDVLVGSFRCPEGYSLSPLLEKEEARALNEGGHERAIGRSIRKKDYIQIATDFVSLREKQSLSLSSLKDESIPILLSDVNKENYSLLSRFEPFGEGFPSPVFSVDVDPSWGKVSSNGKSYLFLDPVSGGKAIYFGNLDCLKDGRYSYYTLKGKFKSSFFRGKQEYSLLSEEIVPHL